MFSPWTWQWYTRRCSLCGLVPRIELRFKISLFPLVLKSYICAREPILTRPALTDVTRLSSRLTGAKDNPVNHKREILVLKPLFRSLSRASPKSGVSHNWNLIHHHSVDSEILSNNSINLNQRTKLYLNERLNSLYFIIYLQKPNAVPDCTADGPILGSLPMNRTAFRHQLRYTDNWQLI